MHRARAALDPAQVPVFDVVSVLGGDFTVGDVARSCDLPRELVAATLDALTDQRVLTADKGRYGFRQARLAEAAYRWLRPAVRRELHGAVAAHAAVPEAARALPRGSRGWRARQRCRPPKRQRREEITRVSGPTCCGRGRWRTWPRSRPVIA